MIKFKALTYKNYMSCGNTPIKIDLCSYKRSVFTGTNGNGKSTVSSALFFVLFGKDIRGINKAKLVNSINNKDLLVEIEFEINSKEYLVKRGVKPNIFEIYCNGKEIDKLPNVRDTQEYLEKNILRMNYNSFKQIVTLGTDTFIPFMKLTAIQRREMIEDLLSLTVFSEMNEILKKKINTLKQDISTNENELRVVDSKKQLLEQQLNDYEQKHIELEKQNSEQLSNFHLKYSDNLKRINKLKENKIKVDDALTILKDSKQELDRINYEYQSKISILKNKKNEVNVFCEQENCPTCNQQITNETKDILKNSLKLELEKNVEFLNELKQKIEKYKEDVLTFKKLEETQKQFNQKISIIENENIKLETEIDVLENKNKETKNLFEIISKIKSQINEYSIKKVNYENILNPLYEKIKITNFIMPLLKDTGIKSKIIENYVPLINQYINEYLSIMDFYVEFELDSDFNEKIKSRYRDEFQYENFSAGEKQRIDLAILFAWRKIAAKRNSLSTNILILDEIGDSSLDSEGVLNLIKILDNLNENNIFVITHNNETKDVLNPDITYEFTKRNNFSEVSVI